MRDDDVTVYSSERGRLCPNCGQSANACVCKQQGSEARGDGIIRVSRSTKGRGGKCVTVITGLTSSDSGIATLARQLKQKCGSGGTIKDGVIEIQGDHRDLIVAELKRLGLTVKLAGG